MLSFVFLAVLLASESNSWDPPFGITISMGAKDNKIINNQVFSVHICLEAWDGDITDLEMSIQPPFEVEKLSGESSWKGELTPKKEKSLYSKFLTLLGISQQEKNPTTPYKKCIVPLLKAKKDIEKWSSPIHGHLELFYEGDKFTRDIMWSATGFNDTGWIGGGGPNRRW